MGWTRQEMDIRSKPRHLKIPIFLSLCSCRPPQTFPSNCNECNAKFQVINFSNTRTDLRFCSCCSKDTIEPVEPSFYFAWTKPEELSFDEKGLQFKEPTSNLPYTAWDSDSYNPYRPKCQLSCDLHLRMYSDGHSICMKNQVSWLFTCLSLIKVGLIEGGGFTLAVMCRLDYSVHLLANVFYSGFSSIASITG
jgi:hypothetical protein